MTRIVIIGGGPAGYEAALVAAQHGADVTVVEADGVGGACVLYDCVPSKTFISSAGVRTDLRRASDLGVDIDLDRAAVELLVVHGRVKGLALAQSADIRARLQREGVRLVPGRAQIVDDVPGMATHRVSVQPAEGAPVVLDADVVLIATGASPRILPTAVPDGERILTWRQIYDLDELPTHLVVVGSGVTGAEFVSAYTEMGVPVTLVSSRDHVLPGEDADAARVLEDVFTRRGMTVMSRSRAASVSRDGDLVTVTLTDGRTVTGSHCLLAVGSIPNTEEMGLETAGVTVDEGGFIGVDRVSRTSARGVYAAGDCTGVMMLASVAAMQGRIAMWHALGDAVAPLDMRSVSSNVFTAPEIATVGATQAQVDSGEVRAIKVNLPLRGNPRAKMQGIRDGFVKLFCLPATGIIVGGVVVAPKASELIHSVAVAVAEKITVDQLAQDFTVYPSLSGSVAEAARRLHGHSTQQLIR